MKLGINGVGRIGKLSLWHHVSRKVFQELVVNIGRNAGQGLEDIAGYLERDSTYGSLGRYIYGFRGSRVIEELNEKTGTMRVNGLPVTILREHRNPKDIQWKEKGVSLVLDCTGIFRDPTSPFDSPKGSLRGHLASGASKVILSAPFKIEDKSKTMPPDALTNIQGINDEAYLPERHHIISAASCTTTCLAFMMKVLLEHFGTEPILSASMVTVHAATGTQEILDRLPNSGTYDMRKNRSIFNNIILTTTGAANALSLVLPEIKDIGFAAESVRIPINTGSIVILTLDLKDENPDRPIDRDQINGIYREAAVGRFRTYVTYTDTQNVSSDIIGTASAAVIEGTETRCRTGTIRVNLSRACRMIPQEEAFIPERGGTLEIPITKVVVYGWYDNELGSFTNMLAERTVEIAQELVER
ncbi:MAG: glyceraldehyde-3-phosphate dehydrogenase [Deltaproteobacteria bacterium]|nr:glyceraldehyde-3-phosphate dehydrogenase [Deltaproteobacteria bacterium]